MIKKLLCLALTALLLGAGLAEEAYHLSFAQSESIDTIAALDGKTVTLTGYMATLSPLSGEYIYLMNLPYQSCPFCVPNTQQLANTMAVYAPSGQTFAFTDRPVRITGRMELGDFSDEYGYTYNYRIADASYETVDLSAVSEEYARYMALAEDGVIADIDNMFNYLLYVCMWPDLQGGYVDENGQQVLFYLYPGDVENVLADTSAYGYGLEAAEGYFPGLIDRVNAIDAEAFSSLTDIITDAWVLERYARSELSGGQYTYDAEADRYSLVNGASLYDQFYAVYGRFSDWLTQYQL